MTGPNEGDLFCVPRINLHHMDATDGSLPFTRRQYPVRLAFCMTISKAQGQTFRRVGVWLPSPVFTHGQLYVALSRVGDGENLWIASGTGFGGS